MLFISWILTRTKGNTFQLSSQYIPSLTYHEFNMFRQENMSRMTKVPTTQTPSTTKPLLSHISGTKLASLPHYIDLFDESFCESAEENLLHLDELKSPPSSLFQSSSYPFELSKPMKTSISNQPCGGVCLRTKTTNIEDPKKVKEVHPNPHSNICNPEPKLSFVLDTPIPQPKPVYSPDISPSPDDPP